MVVGVGGGGGGERREELLKNGWEGGCPSSDEGQVASRAIQSRS